MAPLRPTLTRAPGGRAPITAFVFLGGMSLGALQVGMLRALYERGIVADMLIGTSAGALNAAFIASRPQTVESAHDLAIVWCGLHREDVFPVSVSALVGGLCGQRDHVVPDRALRRLVRRCVEFDDLAEAATPLHVFAVDLIEGCEVLLSDGPAVDIICAATSIPGVFPPVAIGERRLIPGGVVGYTRSPQPASSAPSASTCSPRAMDRGLCASHRVVPWTRRSPP